MKQSNVLFLPKLNEAITFKEFVKRKNSGMQFIAHCEQTDKKNLEIISETGQNITLLIGPEGDFSEKEIALAVENNFISGIFGKHPITNRNRCRGGLSQRGFRE